MQSPESKEYVYGPIDPRTQQFRLAVVQPSPDLSSPVFCDLVETDLEGHPQYEAISYVWGDASQKVPVWVEGALLYITVNLECALRYLRHAQVPRVLWADALCIDQTNVDERGHQVSLMKEIYSHCTADLVWFGEARPETKLALDVLMRMQSLGLQRISNGNLDGKGKAKMFNRVVTVSDLNDADLMAVRHVLVDPTVWQRVWVMQEIACCPQAFLVFGHLLLPWSVLSSILDHSGVPDRYHRTYGHFTFEPDVWNLFSKSQVIEHQRDMLNGVSGSPSSTLLDVLARFRVTYSTDPRDKVYGLLGLASDTMGIKPDYKKSVVDLYLEVARAQISRERNLDIICQSLWPLGDAEGRRLDFVT